MRSERAIQQDLAEVHEQMRELAPPATDPLSQEQEEVPGRTLSDAAMAKWRDLHVAEQRLTLEWCDWLRINGRTEPVGERERAEELLREYGEEPSGP